jgi:hypothetical protein
MYYIELIKEDLITFAEDFGNSKQAAIQNLINDVNEYYNEHYRTLEEIIKDNNIIDVIIRRID